MENRNPEGYIDLQDFLCIAGRLFGVDNYFGGREIPYFFF